MFKYVQDKDVIKDLRDACEDLIKDVQDELREYFTFSFKLIGSGEKRLITVNDGNNHFDLDYNVILQKDKTGIINDPGEIKNLFIKAFNRCNPNLNFEPARNRKSVIKSELKMGSDVYFSFDVAIMCEGNNGNLFKIVYDKQSSRYLWNEIRNSANFDYRFKELKRNGYWEDIKEIYLYKKNMHLSNGDNINSYACLLETVNEIWQREM